MADAAEKRRLARERRKARVLNNTNDRLAKLSSAYSKDAAKEQSLSAPCSAAVRKDDERQRQVETSEVNSGVSSLSPESVSPPSLSDLTGLRPGKGVRPPLDTKLKSMSTSSATTVPPQKITDAPRASSRQSLQPRNDEHKSNTDSAAPARSSAAGLGLTQTLLPLMVACLTLVDFAFMGKIVIAILLSVSMSPFNGMVTLQYLALLVVSHVVYHELQILGTIAPLKLET
eukprot:TRINITY_DN17269_c0_g1_i1.p1 TRINITY_DN17269_c0_g1~~TRINITY_DN17269_c0_g1_i1.p1  ORF type:complete len:230 (+),score=29.32 TRINITY_DN17269_c0_g1_i1:1-690(+)